MNVEVKTVDDSKIIVVPKRFDAYTANSVEEELTRLIGEGTRKIVCDFSQTDYLASAGLRVLIAASKNLQRANGKMVLCSIKAYVLEVFEISGLNKIFKIFGSVDAALQDLKQVV
ncbi:MAG: STAS domain-containing protein [Candidatus Bathyarchaeota archaeon]|nr:STAS domain-containing protein [Candidatus Bathyarchaeota archaeon]